jgi:DNA polymerase-3 subunit epsilon
MWTQSLRRVGYRGRIAGTELEAAWRSKLPSPSTDWRQVPFLVCDAEMSSLQPEEGELLSLGWVCIKDGAIALATARHHLIKAAGSVGQSATIHQLRDCELHGAESEAEVLNHFLAAAAGHILVFHNAALDMAYLNRSTRKLFGAPLLMPCVDTMTREHTRLRHSDTTIQSGDLRLQACRDRYNLPPYPAHNALVDALATAELLVAQSLHRGGNRPFALKNLL